MDGDDLSKVTVQARVVAHERGPKLRIVKFKPKRGYKRRTGHRQELTRIEVTSLGRKAPRSRSKAAATPAPAARRPPTPRRETAMAHKKGLGSSRNGRDSKPKHLGVKVFAGQTVTGGEIIVRQRGTVFKPGDGAGIGQDHTIYARTAGTVAFTRGRRGRVISILPGDPAERQRQRAGSPQPSTPRPPASCQRGSRRSPASRLPARALDPRRADRPCLR